MPTQFDSKGSLPGVLPQYPKPSLANQPKISSPTGNATSQKPGLLGGFLNNTVRPAIGAGIAMATSQGNTPGQLSPGFSKAFNLPQVVAPEHTFPSPSSKNPGAITIGNTPGVLPPKTVDQHIQDKLDTHDQAIANAKKTQADAQKQFDVNQTAGKDINGNTVQTADSMQSASTATPESNAGSNYPTKTGLGPFATNVQNLTGYGSGQESPEVQKAREDLLKFNNARAVSEQGVDEVGGDLNSATGQKAIIENRYATELPGYQQALSSALSSQGQQIGAAGTAGGLSQPVGQFGMLTDPTTGRAINPEMAKSFIQQAMSLYQNGADPQGQAIQQILAPLGGYGQALFSAAINQGQGGGYNPDAASTQVQTNNQLGSGFQSQAANLSTAMQNLDKISPLAINFLSQSGINPQQTAAWNKPINDAIKVAVNPGAAVQWASITNDIRSIAAQVIAAKTPGTPTSNDEMTAAQDPGLLSGSQLQSVLNTWSSLGNLQLGTAQSNARNAYKGSTGYAGNKAAPTPSSIPVAPVNSSNAAQFLNKNPVAEGAFGIGSSIFHEITSLPALIGGLIGHIFK